MRRWLRGGVAAALVLLPFAGSFECRAAGEGTIGPQESVNNFIKNLAALKIEKAAAAWVAEKTGDVRAIMKTVPPGTIISLSRLKVSEIHRTESTAKMSAYYLMRIIAKGKPAVWKKGTSDAFFLKKTNGAWLISGSSIWRAGPWKSSSSATPADIKASNNIVAAAARAIKAKDTAAFTALMSSQVLEGADKSPDFSGPDAARFADSLLKARIVKTYPDTIVYERIDNGTPVSFTTVNEEGGWKIGDQ